MRLKARRFHGEIDVTSYRDDRDSKEAAAEREKERSSAWNI